MDYLCAVLSAFVSLQLVQVIFLQLGSFDQSFSFQTARISKNNQKYNTDTHIVKVTYQYHLHCVHKIGIHPAYHQIHFMAQTRKVIKATKYTIYKTIKNKQKTKTQFYQRTSLVESPWNVCS